MKEENFIERLRGWRVYSEPSLGFGIGDDAAQYGGLLISKDLSVEGIHFSLDLMTPYEVGRRAVLVNLSDIAAMGGAPTAVLMGISFNGDEAFFREFSEGARRVCEEFGVNLIGGDITGSPGPVFVSITVIGKAHKAVKRGKAKPGELICVTGTLGDAALGLELLKKGLGHEFPELSRRYKNPTPRIKEGALLSGVATSMIDLSDGLSLDLRRLVEGAVIDWDRIPTSREYDRAMDKLFSDMDKKYFAVFGGDDYELLFTVPRERIDVLKNMPFPVTVVGEVVENGFFIRKKGGLAPLEAKGYEHFG